MRSQISNITKFSQPTLIILLTAVFFLCAKAHALHKGRVAGPQEFPSTVRLSFTKDDVVNICTGTKIGPRLVLTAAHCFGNFKIQNWECGEVLKQIKVRNESTRESARLITGIHIHSDITELGMTLDVDVEKRYRNRKDLALVEFASELPASISTASYSPSLVEAGQNVIIGGYGLEEINGSKFSDHLKTSNSRVKDISQKQFSFEVQGGAFLLSGDSGGPVYQRVDGDLKLVGINTRHEPANLTRVQGPGERGFWTVRDYVSFATKINLPIRRWIEQVSQRRPSPECRPIN